MSRLWSKQLCLLYNMVHPVVSEVLLGGYDPVWGLWQIPVEDSRCRLLPLPNPASALSIPQALIIHKYHSLQTVSLSRSASRDSNLHQKAWNIVSSGPRGKKMVLWTHSISCTTCQSIAPISPDHLGSFLSSIIWEKKFVSSYLLESLCYSRLLCCLLFPFIALSSSNNGNSYHLIGAF